MRTDELFCEVSSGVGLDQNQNAAHSSEQQLNVSETSTDKTWDSNPVPTVDDDNEVRHHVNQGPRHT